MNPSAAPQTSNYQRDTVSAPREVALPFCSPTSRQKGFALPIPLRGARAPIRASAYRTSLSEDPVVSNDVKRLELDGLRNETFALTKRTRCRGGCLAKELPT